MRKLSFRPAIEPRKARALMSGGAVATGPHSEVATVATSRVAGYRDFHGTVPIAHGKTLSLDGPILLAPTDGRGQVVGALFLADGSEAAVLGQIYGAGVSLQVTTAQGRVLHAGGSGLLGRVAGGMPGYDALFGGGNLSPTNGPFVIGRWRSSPRGQ